MDNITFYRSIIDKLLKKTLDKSVKWRRSHNSTEIFEVEKAKYKICLSGCYMVCGSGDVFFLLYDDHNEDSIDSFTSDDKNLVLLYNEVKWQVNDMDKAIETILKEIDKL